MDDGSTDDTASRLAELFGEDRRVRIEAIDRQGPSGARNVGLSLATGSHVALPDSDDEWLDWKTEFQLQCLEQVPSVQMIWSDMTAVDPDGKVIAGRYLRSMYRRYSELDLEEVLETRRITNPLGQPVPVHHGDIYKAMIHRESRAHLHRADDPRSFGCSRRVR